MKSSKDTNKYYLNKFTFVHLGREFNDTCIWTKLKAKLLSSMHGVCTCIKIVD